MALCAGSTNQVVSTAVAIVAVGKKLLCAMGAATSEAKMMATSAWVAVSKGAEVACGAMPMTSEKMFLEYAAEVKLAVMASKEALQADLQTLYIWHWHCAGNASPDSPALLTVPALLV